MGSMLSDQGIQKFLLYTLGPFGVTFIYPVTLLGDVLYPGTLCSDVHKHWDPVE